MRSEMDNEQSTRTNFDRVLAGLHGLPDVTNTKPSTVRSVNFIGASSTHIITTYRMKDRGDTIFLEVIDEDGAKRLVLPPGVADAIARQRESLTTQVRRKVGKASAAARKAAGLAPAFMANKGKGGRKPRKGASHGR